MPPEQRGPPDKRRIKKNCHHTKYLQQQTLQDKNIDHTISTSAVVNDNNKNNFDINVMPSYPTEELPSFNNNNNNDDDNIGYVALSNDARRVIKNNNDNFRVIKTK